MREWWIIYNNAYNIDSVASLEPDLNSNRYPKGFTSIHVVEFSELEKARAELEKWKLLEEYTKLSFMEIYGQAEKLKRGKPSTRKVDWPGNKSCTDIGKKIHDDLCQMLEDMGYNDDSVCTASMGMWGAIRLCQEEWYDKLTAENIKLRTALEFYADERTYKIPASRGATSQIIPCANIYEDEGSIARKALSENGGEGE